MLNTSIQLNLNTTASEEIVDIAPGTPLRIDTVIDTGAIDGAAITVYALLGDASGQRLAAIGSPIAAAGTTSLSAANLTGVTRLLLRVTTASGTAQTRAALTLAQDVPGYVVQNAQTGPPLMIG